MNIILRNRAPKDCSIVAAYNASSWCNMGLTYEDILPVAEIAGFNHDLGITTTNFSELVLALNIPAKEVKNQDPFNLQTILRTGRAIVVLYCENGKKEGHAITLIPVRDHIKIVNKDRKWATWNEFAADIYVGAIKFEAWALPHRGAA